MANREQQDIALHRWAVIAEAANDRLSAAERGALVQQIASRHRRETADHAARRPAAITRRARRLGPGRPRRA